MSTERDVPKKYYKWIILVTCCLVYSMAYLCRRNYTGVASYLMTEWEIGKGEIGLIGSAFYFAYAIGQNAWAKLIDMYGERKVIALSVGLTGVCLGLFAVATSYAQGMFFRVLMGCVSGATYAPCLSLIAKWFPKKERGFAMNMFSGPGGGSGEAIAFLLVPVIAIFLTGDNTLFGLTTWRASTMIFALVACSVAVVTYVFVRNDPREVGMPSVQVAEDGKASETQNFNTLLFQAFKDPWYWLVSIAWIGFIVALRTIPGWLPIYATSYYAQNMGLPTAQAAIAGGVIGTMFVVGRVIGSPLMGSLCDWVLVKKGVPRMQFAGLIQLSIFIGLIIMTRPLPSPLILGVIAFCFGVLCNSFGLIPAATTEIWNIKTSGFLIAMQNMIGQIFGATVLSVSGFIAVRWAVKGAGVHSEYQGIWYLGMAFMSVTIIACLLSGIREKRAIAEKKRIQEEDAAEATKAGS